MKRVAIVLLIAGTCSGIAEAQQPRGGGGERLNAPYTTSTGATVPNPGKSQGGGTTSLDRGIQRENNKIDSSICKGC